ncbi:hypothetical protein MAE02_50920 [Microvirga aerophila]|uniref:Uncharacterized protein n=1 Tax=Microvirga aerophila TaxID=670291 RepID=A0A512BZK4_9HYPH|nr:hypothetical protein MAE02_50920 [Microvirga aerophila]
MLGVRMGGPREAINHYFDIAPDVQRADWAFFNRSPHRRHLIRKPYPGELTSELGKDCLRYEASIVVVRQHGPGLIDRRAFTVTYAEGSSFIEVLKSFYPRNEEAIGRALWVLSNDVDTEVFLDINPVNILVSAFDNLEQFPIWG